MAKLSYCLPPFAGDYSGACALLFELDCLIIIVDAGCCTRNYTEHEELRWRKKRRATFSAQIRTLDIALGDETSLISNTVQAAEQLKPSYVVFVGTPVPALVGMDLEGIAMEAETMSGIPAFGINTTGFETYEEGASKALLALCQKTLDKRDGNEALARKSCGSEKGAEKTTKYRLNILGASPLDFSQEHDMYRLEEALDRCSASLNFTSFSRKQQNSIKSMWQADANLVVSTSGLEAAALMERMSGIPTIRGVPLDKKQEEALEDLLKKGISGNVWDGIEKSEGDQGIHEEQEGPQVFLVGDQIGMNSLREGIVNSSQGLLCKSQLSVCSFFSMDRTLMAAQDIHFEKEQDFVELVLRNPSACFVGDPLLLRVPGIREDSFKSLPHSAISSNLYLEESIGLYGFLDKIAASSWKSKIYP